MIDPDLSLLLDAVLRDQSDRLAKLVAADIAADCNLVSLEWLLRYTAADSFTRPLLSTGSRVYGEPREGSDWDWVVLSLGTTTRSQLSRHCDSSTFPQTSMMYPVQTIESRLEGTYRFGPVNIIHAGDQVQWEIWQEGTAVLKYEVARYRKPRTRERAIEVFSRITEEKYRVLDGVPQP